MKRYFLALFFLVAAISFSGHAISADESGAGPVPESPKYPLAYSYGVTQYEMVDHTNGKVYKIVRNVSPYQVVEIDFVHGTVNVVRKLTADEWQMIQN